MCCFNWGGCRSNCRNNWNQRELREAYCAGYRDGCRNAPCNWSDNSNDCNECGQINDSSECNDYNNYYNYDYDYNYDYNYDPNYNPNYTCQETNNQ
ncbi:hypothetical protein [Clostridium sp. HBUAS56010]|uniref:hypothetical protein n=1 Tax=Clostridium sp. HBUAS56010 TaxID=2571127 RepID=UPI001177C33D|nr:hypothetical protein [Clostridium sp. HBUAS56010]